MGTICIKAPEVIFKGDCEVFLMTKPHRLKLFHELKRVTKVVRIDKATVGDGKVLVDGTLLKNVEYKRQDGVIGAVDFTIPFGCCVDTPGALPGDWVEIEDARVVLEEEFSGIPPRELVDKVDIFEKFWEKVCIRVDFKVLRNVQVTVNTVEPSICP